MTLADLKALVAKQAEDPGLWFMYERITECYLQKALRELHAAIEEMEEAGDGE
jgi:hypothetical protein